MTPRQRIQNLLQGKPVDRVPFCPAIYEHKAALIGVSPSEMCQDDGLFEKAVIREVEIYDPDMLVVGCDVYNVEAEAAGCAVRFYDSNDIPSIAERAVRVGDAISTVRLPDPERDGRMPICLETGWRIQERFGREMIVRGALSAPFSIACELVGAEKLLIAMADDPEWVSRLLVVASEIAVGYGRAFAERGLGLILFDSHASPPLVSPGMYKKIVLPPTSAVIHYFRHELGMPLVPYIIGGDTTSLVDLIVQTGTNNILCDFRADLGAYIDRLRGKPILLRANLDPRFLARATIKDIKKKTREVLTIGRRYPGFMLGTGILPYDLPPEKVIAVRDVLEEL